MKRNLIIEKTTEFNVKMNCVYVMKKCAAFYQTYKKTKTGYILQH